MNTGSLRERAWSEAGISDVAVKLLAGHGISEDELARVRHADLLAVGALADALRANFRGDDVALLTTSAGSVMEDALSQVAIVTFAGADGTKTGVEMLRAVALTRIATPAKVGVAVSWDDVGIEIAQVALTFGADMLFGSAASASSLPVLESSSRKRDEITGLVARAGRNARWVSVVDQSVGGAP